MLSRGRIGGVSGSAAVRGPRSQTPGLQRAARSLANASVRHSTAPALPAVAGTRRPAHTRLRTAASASAGVGAGMAQVAESASLAVGFAKVSGTAMSVGASLLFSPIILTMVKTRSGDGISRFTFWLQLIGFTAIFLYNASKGFPIAAYGENISLAAQSLIILLLATHYQRRFSLVFFFGLAAYFGWVAVCLGGFFSPTAMLVMQVLATIILTGAIIPQILLNFQRKDTGEWSILTAIFSTLGNGLRVFTTLQLTQDPLLLAGYILGFAVNATLLGQIILYGRPKLKTASGPEAPVGNSGTSRP